MERWNHNDQLDAVECKVTLTLEICTSNKLKIKQHGCVAKGLIKNAL